MAGRSLKQLLDAAVFRQELWTGSIQDQSRNQIAMTYSGASRWTREGALIALRQSASNDMTRTPAILPPVDFTVSPFFVEFVWRAPRITSNVFYQANAGGWYVLWVAGGAYLRVGVYTAAVAAARHVTTPNNAAPPGVLVHAIGWLDATAGGLAGQWWINGAAAASVFTNTAPPVLGNPATLNVCGNGGPGMSCVLARVFPGTPTFDEVTTLYEASQRLVTPQSTIFRSFPERYAREGEPGVAAHYIFRPEELAQGRYLDRQGGGIDLPSKRGMPQVGPDGGVRANDAANAGWGTAATPVPPAGTPNTYVMEIGDVAANPTATRYLMINASVAGFEFRLDNAGVLSASFDRATLASAAAGILNGRGKVRVAARYDGVNQHLDLNGRTVASVAVAPAAPDGYFAVGEHGTITRAKPILAQRTAAEERAEYVREFAREVIHLWKPGEEGETNATGLVTGSTLPGGGFVPLGAASLKFEWIRDASLPGGGLLGLTDTGAVSLRRVSLPHETRPAFGAWLIDYRVRNPAWGGDEMIFALTPRRDVDPTAAGSQSYWVRCYNNGGGWWRCELKYENGANIDAVDMMAALIPVGCPMKLLVTRRVSGDWQLYTYCDAPDVKQWFWSAALGNHVTQLSSACVQIAPRGSWVTGFARYQSEMEPGELGR